MLGLIEHAQGMAGSPGDGNLLRVNFDGTAKVLTQEKPEGTTIQLFEQ
jgi:hypothetical protein